MTRLRLLLLTTSTVRSSDSPLPISACVESCCIYLTKHRSLVTRRTGRCASSGRGANHGLDSPSPPPPHWRSTCEQDASRRTIMRGTRARYAPILPVSNSTRRVRANMRKDVVHPTRRSFERLAQRRKHGESSSLTVRGWLKHQLRAGRNGQSLRSSYPARLPHMSSHRGEASMLLKYRVQTLFIFAKEYRTM